MNRKLLLGAGLVGLGAAILSLKKMPEEDLVENGYPPPPLPTYSPTQREVLITLIVWPVDDRISRYHGVTIDKGLNRDFYRSQPDTVIQITAQAFTHIYTHILSVGTHTVEYGNSGYCEELEGYGRLNWGARILIDEIPLIENECIGRDKHLKASFTVA